MVVAGATLQLFSVPAAAQSKEPSRFSVAAGVGRAVDSYYEDAFAWHLSTRIPTAKPVSIEVTFDRWIHESTRVRKDVTIPVTFDRR